MTDKKTLMLDKISEYKTAFGVDDISMLPDSAKVKLKEFKDSLLARPQETENATPAALDAVQRAGQYKGQFGEAPPNAIEILKGAAKGIGQLTLDDIKFIGDVVGGKMPGARAVAEKISGKTIPDRPGLGERLARITGAEQALQPSNTEQAGGKNAAYYTALTGQVLPAAANLAAKAPAAIKAVGRGLKDLKLGSQAGRVSLAGEKAEAAAKLGRTGKPLETMTPDEIIETATGEGVDINRSIPDIESAEKIDISVGPKSTKQIKKDLDKTLGKAPPKPFGSRLEEVERRILSAQEELDELPFPEYVKRAIQTKDYTPQAASAFDLVAHSGLDALNQISEQKSATGRAISKLISDTQATKPDAANISKFPLAGFAEAIIQDISGGKMTPMGKLVAAPGKGIKVGDTDIKAIEKIWAEIMTLGGGKSTTATLDQLWALKQRIGGLIGDVTVPGKKQTALSAIEKKIYSQINNMMETAIGPMRKEGGKSFKQLNKDYSNLLTMQKTLGKSMGQVIELPSGDKFAQHGAGLAKSAISSNADRKSKAIFEAVKQLTGIDIFKEAYKAKMAMEAVGDPRAVELLRAAGVGSGLVQGRAGAIMEGAKTAGRFIRGSMADEMLDYYYKSRFRSGPKGSTSRALRRVGATGAGPAAGAGAGYGAYKYLTSGKGE